MYETIGEFVGRREEGWIRVLMCMVFLELLICWNLWNLGSRYTKEFIYKGNQTWFFDFHFSFD